MLKHRNGTNFEDIHFIDADTGDIIHKLDTCNIPNGVDYDDETKKAIADARKAGRRIIAVHNHPGGLPPTLDDGVSAYNNDYVMGVSVGHNLEVFSYGKTDYSYSKKECKELHGLISNALRFELNLMMKYGILLLGSMEWRFSVNE